MRPRTGQILGRGERRYLVRWFLGRGEDGRKRYASQIVHGTKREAQRVLREKLSRQDHGHAAPSPSSVPRLREFVDTWEKGQSAATLRERTRRDYRELLDRYVIPKLGELRIDAIHTATIEELVVRPIAAREKYRAARLAVCALSRVFKSAMKDRTLGLAGNPCSGVEIGKKPRAVVQPLTKDERAAFRKAIAGTKHELLFALMMLTGLGPGEAFAVGWEHVDLESGTLRVARTLDTQTAQLVEDTKRPSRKRVVPLVAELRAMLRKAWLAVGRPAAGLVFTDELDAPLDLHNVRRRSFAAALTAAGITRKVRLYDLRHGFATAGLEAGLDVRTVADLMGHSSTRTTLDVYQHTTDERRREGARRIGDALLGSNAPK